MAQLFEPGAPFHGTYTIVRMIGRGGIGEVYEAKHDFLGRKVAIKCVRLRTSLPKTSAQRMAKEAQALCALDHPNIIRIFDAGAEGEVMFMVTELLDGGTLRDKLEAERRVPLLPALRYHVEWADALVQVHGAGIIHRDLKPENVFITKSGASKLLDFGAALDSQRITMHGHTVGTPAYMAPEHLTGEVAIDPRADIYPMGVMLFEALTGQHPFVSPTDVELPDHFEFARRHLLEPWPRLTEVLPGTPPGVEAIVDRCMAKNRDERFPNMQALREALRAVLDDVNTPSALPLVQRAADADAVRKTKPLPRQTAMRMEKGATMMIPRTTERLTPTPEPGLGVAGPKLLATAPMDPARRARAITPTLEGTAPAGAAATPPPVSPSMAVAMPPAAARPLIPSRAPAAIAILAIGVVGLCAAGWFFLRAPAGGPGAAPEPSATAASATVAAAEPPASTAPDSAESATPEAAASVAASAAASAGAGAGTAASAGPSASTGTAAGAGPSAGAIAGPPPRPRPPPKPKPQQQPPPGPVPIFER